MRTTDTLTNQNTTMTKEDKELLLRDLCARLPYRPIIHVEDYTNDEKLLDMYDWNLLDVVYFQDKLELSIEPNWDNYRTVKLGYRNYIIKPYLRPMSSMTVEEGMEYYGLCHSEEDSYSHLYYYDTMESIDWLNAHHFDYRGLIEMGLAIEAPEGMYNEKEK